MGMIADDIDLSLISFFIVALLLIVRFFNIKLWYFYLSFHYMFLVFLHRVSRVIIKIIWELFFDRNYEDKKSPAGQVDFVSKKLAASAEDLALKPSLSGKNLEYEKLSIEEVNMTLGKLTDSSEIDVLFEEEVSVEEVNEAFGLFDKNEDGFIDAKELRNVLCSLGYTEASEADCKRMISAFDVDGDGQIDIKEFVKLLEYSFS